MNRRHFIQTSTAAYLLAAGPARASKLSLAAISEYLNSFRTAAAKFTQINADGSISTGQLALRRPGRARFDYDGDNSLVIAGGGTVAIFDPVSNTPPTQYPLRRTPLNHVLARNVDLGRSGMLVGHDFDGTSTSVTLQDPEHPEYGNIKLVFTNAPVVLRQWIITDDSGQPTTVVLGDMETDAKLGSGLFNIPLEIERRGLN